MQHFYSPIPGRGSLPPSFWASQSELPGVEAFDTERQLHFFEHELAGFIAEFMPPREQPANRTSSSCATVATRVVTPTWRTR